MNLTLGIIAGIAAYAALNHLVVGTRGPRQTLHRSLGAFAAAAAIYVSCGVILFTADNVEVVRLWSRVQGAAGALVVMGAIWFALVALGHLEGPRLRRISVLGLWTNIAGLVAVAFLSLRMPAGIFYGQIQGIERVSGVLGPITLPVATPNPWQPVANLFLYAPLLFILPRTVQVYRGGRRRLALLATIALLLPGIPAMIDTYVLGIGTFPLPVTETGLALSLLFLSAIVSDDVARTAQLRRELAASEARHRWLVETAPEAICVYDPERRRFTLVNGPAEQLFGRPRSELLAITPASLLAPGDDGDRFQRLIEAAVAGERPVVEWEVRGPDDERIPCDLRLATLPAASGGRVRISLIDTRARKAEEAERAEIAAKLRRSEKLQTIGTLAEGIVHDFNNLLTPIVGYGELAASELEEHPASSYVAEMIASSERARELVRQILAFRSDSGRQTETFAIEPIVKQALRFLRAALPPGVELETDLAAGEVRIAGDPTHVHQVVMNLGLNAAHAMGDGGRLEVRLGRTADHVVLVVADQGAGMDEDTLRQIYEPFFTTKGPGHGTGLGLAVVHQIVEGWSGRIDVDSEPGRGTTFRITIPVATDEPTASDEDRPPHRGDEAVLVIDDESAVANVVSRLLSQLGYQVTTYTDPEEALLSLGRARFDLCITDFDMPNLDGHDVASRLRQLYPGLPVILMSGATEGLERQPDSPGPWYPLPKPFRRAELSDALAAVLPRESEPDRVPAE